jgi:hypothetical protein
MQQSKVATGADFRMSPRLPFGSFETHAFGPSTLVCDCGVLMGLGMPFALSVQRTSFGAGLALPNFTSGIYSKAAADGKSGLAPF